MELLNDYLPKDLINMIDEYLIDTTNKDYMIKELNWRINRFSEYLNLTISCHPNIGVYTFKHKYDNGIKFEIPINKSYFVRLLKDKHDKLHVYKPYGTELVDFFT